VVVVQTRDSQAMKVLNVFLERITPYFALLNLGLMLLLALGVWGTFQRLRE
jgi:hypothetical protein